MQCSGGSYSASQSYLRTAFPSPSRGVCWRSASAGSWRVRGPPGCIENRQLGVLVTYVSSRAGRW